MRILLLAVIALTIAACASIGRPEGGPRDETPPEYVKSNPVPGTKNFDKNKIEIFFDENIKIEDASNKFVVSPAQQQMPQIVANGKKLTVTLRDTLIENQTYTLDFSDAIRDLNEGNILDGFVLDFSTGDSIDSLRIAGMVLEARTLEPAQGMIVGAYRNLSDTAISTVKVERICKTNQLGQFTLRNLKPEYYRLFALNDVNRDFHWDRSEDIAFYDIPVRPWSEEIMVTDTLMASDGRDSIVDRQGIRYLPNDILLTWFNENYMPLYMTDHTRDKRNLIKLQFSTNVDTLPVLTVVNGENEGKIISDYAKINKSLKNDTLEYWIEDSSLIMQDSLLIATKYLKTDSLNEISWTTDTIRYFFRMSRAEEKELEDKEKERKRKEEKRQEAIKKWNETGDSAYLADTALIPEPIPYIEIKGYGSSQDYHKPLRLSFSEPLKNLDESGIHLEWLEDSTWHLIEDVVLKQDTTGKIMEYFVEQPWEFETKYRFTIDSAATTSIYNKPNKEYVNQFTIKSAEDYSTLIFDIPNSPYKMPEHYNWDSLMSKMGRVDSLPVDSATYSKDSLGNGEYIVMLPSEVLNTDSLTVNETVVNNTEIITDDKTTVKPQIMVELLTQNEKTVASVPVVNGKARFEFISPGTYYARAYIDFNGNGEWDTGNIESWTQPEDVFYYPKKITLKQNWDMSQTWDLFEIPLDTQKPLEIKKNKPKTKEKQPINDDEEEEDFGSNYFYEGNSYGNGSTYNNARRNNVGSGFQRNNMR